MFGQDQRRTGISFILVPYSIAHLSPSQLLPRCLVTPALERVDVAKPALLPVGPPGSSRCLPLHWRVSGDLVRLRVSLRLVHEVDGRILLQDRSRSGDRRLVAGVRGNMASGCAGGSSMLRGCAGLARLSRGASNGKWGDDFGRDSRSTLARGIEGRSPTRRRLYRGLSISFACMRLRLSLLEPPQLQPLKHSPPLTWSQSS